MPRVQDPPLNDLPRHWVSTSMRTYSPGLQVQLELQYLRRGPDPADPPPSTLCVTHSFIISHTMRPNVLVQSTVQFSSADTDTNTDAVSEGFGADSPILCSLEDPASCEHSYKDNVIRYQVFTVCLRGVYGVT